jgi:hypothetical protein
MAITDIVVSGKLFQDDGDPVENATVQLLETGTSTVEATLSGGTTAAGLWTLTETSLDTTYDVKITSGTSIRYILWSDEITLKGIDTASLKVRGVEGAAAPIYLFADQADDAGDAWRIQASASDTLAIGSDKAVAGTIIDYLTITNGANAAASTVTVGGILTVTTTLDVNGTADYDVTDYDIASSGDIDLVSTNDAVGAIYLRENAGTSGTIKIHADQGTSVAEGAESVTILSDAGGVGVRSTANLANAVNLTVDGGTSSTMTLFNDQGTAATEGAASIQLLSDVGGVNIKSGLNGANAILLTADGGTSETIVIHADQGTGTGSIELLSDAGGIELDAGTDIILDAGGTDIFLKDDGTLFGTLHNSSGELVIKSSSSGTTAATFSGANVTFAGTVDATTDFTIGSTVITDDVITFTPSSSDTVTLTSSANGAFSLVTVDNAAAAANIQITADGTAELAGTTVTLDSAADIELEATNDINVPASVGLTFGDDGEKIEGDGSNLVVESSGTLDMNSGGVLTLDSGAAINIEPAGGSAILLDGTISVDAGVVTGASSITSTAFVGTLSTGAQTNITSLGTITSDLHLDADLDFQGAQSITTTTGDLTVAVNAGADVLIGDDVTLLKIDGGADSVILPGNSDANTILDIQTPGTGDPAITFTGTGTDTHWYIGVDNGNDVLRIGTGTTMGSNIFLSFDPRTTSPAISVAQLFGSTPASTMTSGSTSTIFGLEMVSATLTLTGTTTTTLEGSWLQVSGPTITNSSASTMNAYSTVKVTPPIGAGSVTLTSAMGIHVVDAGAGTPTTQYGLYMDSLTAGVADVGISMANDLVIRSGGVISVDDTTESTSTTTGSIHTDGGMAVLKDEYVGGQVHQRLSTQRGFLRAIISKLDLDDNTATNVFTITTTNETAGNDGGCYFVTVKGIACTHRSSLMYNTADNAVVGYHYVFAHTNSNAGADANTAVTEVAETADVPSPGSTFVISTVTMTVVATSNTVTTIQFLINSNNATDNDVSLTVEVHWFDYQTEPVIAAA